MSNDEKDPHLPPGLDDIDAFFQRVVSSNAIPEGSLREGAQPTEKSDLTIQQQHLQEDCMTELLTKMIDIDSRSHPEEQVTRLWEQFPDIIRRSAQVKLQRREESLAEAIKQITLERLAQFTDRKAEDWGRKVGSSIGTPMHMQYERIANQWARYNTVAQAAWRMEQQGRPRPQQQ